MLRQGLLEQPVKSCGLCPPSSRPPRSVRVCSLLYSPVFFFPFKFAGIFPASGTGSDQLRGSADTEGEGQTERCGFTRGKLLLSPVRAWPGNQSATSSQEKLVLIQTCLIKSVFWKARGVHLTSVTKRVRGSMMSKKCLNLP